MASMTDMFSAVAAVISAIHFSAMDFQMFFHITPESESHSIPPKVPLGISQYLL